VTQAVDSSAPKGGEALESRRFVPELAAAAVITVGGLALSLATRGFPEGARAYPLLVGLLMAACGVVIGISVIRGRVATTAAADLRSEFEKLADSVDDGTERVPVKDFAACLVSVAALVIGLQWISFLVLAPLVGAGILRFMYHSTWRTTVLGAVVMAASATVCMHFLGAPIPGLDA
jgi:hypothetical protein